MKHINPYEATLPYDAGEPYDVLRAGDYFILPWKVKHPTHTKRWTLYPHLWRSFSGNAVEFDIVAAWARKRGLILRRETFIPNTTGGMRDPI